MTDMVLLMTNRRQGGSNWSEIQAEAQEMLTSVQLSQAVWHWESPHGCRQGGGAQGKSVQHSYCRTEI